jgi:hypothetical protein
MDQDPGGNHSATRQKKVGGYERFAKAFGIADQNCNGKQACQSRKYYEYKDDQTPGVFQFGGLNAGSDVCKRDFQPGQQNKAPGKHIPCKDTLDWQSHVTVCQQKSNECRDNADRKALMGIKVSKAH